MADEDRAGKSPADEPNALIGFWRYLLQSLETRLALIAGGIVVLSLAAGWLGLPDWVAIVLQIGGAYAGRGGPSLAAASSTCGSTNTFNINFLMTLAGIGAVVIGEYAEAASMILLFDLAEALEGFTNEKARGTLSQLTNLKPSHAILRGEDEDVWSRWSTLHWEIGSWSGRVTASRWMGPFWMGRATSTRPPITGESIPVWKEPAAKSSAVQSMGPGN